MISRSAIRKDFASLLRAALVGVGLPAQAVYEFQIGDFAGASPVVVVSSGPIRRLIENFGNCDHAVILLNVYVFVLYADRPSDWDEADAEDAIDAIEKIVAETVSDNQHGANWNSAAYTDAPTSLMNVVIGGQEYRRELIQVKFEVLQ